MCIPVHSPWLPGYTDVTQTVHVALTMAGLFPDRPGVEQLANMTLLRLTFRGAATQFDTAAVAFYVLTGSAPGFQSPHLLVSTYFLCF